MGAGIIWWGSEYQSLSGYGLAGFDKKSFWDSTGNMLPVVDALGQLLAPVQLGASLTPQALSLRWPLSGAGFSLTTASNLDTSVQWFPVTNAVQTLGTNFGLALPLDQNSSRYYRLESK
jgi:hypothetical protein